MYLIDRLVEPEALGDLPIAGVAQHGVTAADQHRDIVSRDVESVEQRLGVGIMIEVDIRERMVIAGQELLDPTRTTSPTPFAISSARRRMNARMTMSLSSASV